MKTSAKKFIRNILTDYFPKLLPIAQRFAHTLSLGPYTIHSNVPPRDYAHAAKDLAKQATKLNTGPHQHIVLYTHGLTSGGAERQWCYLAKELSLRGYAVTLVVNSLEGEASHYLPLLENTKVSVRCIRDITISEAAYAKLPTSKAPYPACELAAALVQLKATHLLCQLDYTNIMGVMAGQLAGVQKILISFRNVNPSHFPYFYESWMHPCYRAFLPIHNLIWSGNSTFGNNDYAQWLAMDQGRIKTIHNAIDIPAPLSAEERDTLRTELGIDKDAPVILGVFRLSGEKNIPLFIKTVAQVAKAIPHLVVLHAGVGPLEEQAKKLIEKNNLQNNVRLLGRRSDISKLMGVADILLLTSTKEGLPNVVLEAEAMGLPVVGTIVGGVSEAVQEGETALLAPSEDCTTLTKHCIYLLQNPSVRKEMGQKGHEFVLQHFSHTSLGDSTLNALELPHSVQHSTNFENTLPQEDLSFTERFAQSHLNALFENCSIPCIVFSSSTDNFFNALPFPKHSLCLCLQKPLHQNENAFLFNWKEEQDWAIIQQKLPNQSIAIFTDPEGLHISIRQKLPQCGIEEIILFDQGNMYRMPTIHPGILKRACAWFVQYIKGVFR